MIDEVVGFLLLVLALATATLLLWEAYTYSQSLPGVEEAAEMCLDSYYNGTSVEGVSCEVYGKVWGEGYSPTPE